MMSSLWFNIDCLFVLGYHDGYQLPWTMALARLLCPNGHTKVPCDGDDCGYIDGSANGGGGAEGGGWSLVLTEEELCSRWFTHHVELATYSPHPVCMSAECSGNHTGLTHLLPTGGEPVNCDDYCAFGVFVIRRPFPSNTQSRGRVVEILLAAWDAAALHWVHAESLLGMWNRLKGFFSCIALCDVASVTWCVRTLKITLNWEV